MPIHLMYKEPGQDRGTDVTAGVGFDSHKEAGEFLEQLAAEMPDNTLAYYRDGPMGMAGKAWIIRDHEPLLVWTARIYRRDRITMAQAMLAAPNLSTSEIREFFS